MIVVSSVPELPPVITPEGELVGASHEYVVPTGIVPSVGVIDIPEPVHTSCSMLSIDGSGFTVIVNVCGVPSQSLDEGVTENSTWALILFEFIIFWTLKLPVPCWTYPLRYVSEDVKDQE